MDKGFDWFTRFLETESTHSSRESVKIDYNNTRFSVLIQFLSCDFVLVQRFCECDLKQMNSFPLEV